MTQVLQISSSLAEKVQTVDKNEYYIYTDNSSVFTFLLKITMSTPSESSCLPN